MKYDSMKYVCLMITNLYMMIKQSYIQIARTYIFQEKIVLWQFVELRTLCDTHCNSKLEVNKITYLLQLLKYIHRSW